MLATHDTAKVSDRRATAAVSLLAASLLVLVSCGQGTARVEAGKSNRTARAQTPCPAAERPIAGAPSPTTKPVTLQDMYGANPGERIRVGAGDGLVQGWVDWDVLVPPAGQPMPDMAPVFGSADASDQQVIAYWVKAAGWVTRERVDEPGFDVNHLIAERRAAALRLKEQAPQPGEAPAGC